MRTARTRTKPIAPPMMPPFAAVVRLVAGAAVALGLAVPIRLVEEVMVEDKVVVDGLVGFALSGMPEDRDVGDRVVFDAQGVVKNSHGSTQPYWQPLLSRQLCQEQFNISLNSM
jgi:hypothetical protein